MAGPVVVLAGGTGGARLARGLLDEAGPDLVVIANTGDDIEIHGAHVSPDPDLCAYWLADRIDSRGWGLDGDTFHVMDGLRNLGEDVWFNLGDRDLAVCLQRARRLAEGATLTQALAELTAALGIEHARVLPMTDAPVRTRVRARGRETGLQEFMIRERAGGPIEDIRFEGADTAVPTSEVLAALATARAIIIGPSNPVISIGPILAIPGMTDALVRAPAPVDAVRPIVGGTVLKGPTASCMQWAGRTVDAAGVAATYAGVIDGLVCDEPCDLLPALQTTTRMDDAEARRRLAYETLRFTEALRT